MTGPGDKLKEFMRRFIGPKSQQAYRQVQHSVSGKGDVRGVKKRKLMEGLTGDPVKDEKILYGESKESIFNRPLTVEDQRPKKNGHPKITDDDKTYAEKLKKIQQSVLPTASDTARVTPTPKHSKILSQFQDDPPGKFIGKVAKKIKAKKQKKQEIKQRHEEIYAQQQQAIAEGNFSSTQNPVSKSKKTKKKKTRHIPTKF
jgi:hypothetical protein